jgi:hypothetical protein
MIRPMKNAREAVIKDRQLLANLLSSVALGTLAKAEEPATPVHRNYALR